MEMDDLVAGTVASIRFFTKLVADGIVPLPDILECPFRHAQAVLSLAAHPPRLESSWKHVIKQLNNLGFDLNIADPTTGTTLAMAAAATGSHELLRALNGHVRDWDTRDFYGRTALQYVAYNAASTAGPDSRDAITVQVLLDVCAAMEAVFDNNLDPCKCYDSVCVTTMPHWRILEYIMQSKDYQLMDHATRHIYKIWLEIDEKDRPKIDTRWWIMAVLTENNDAIRSWEKEKMGKNGSFGIAMIHMACRVAGLGYYVPLGILTHDNVEVIGDDEMNGLWVRDAFLFSSVFVFVFLNVAR